VILLRARYKYKNNNNTLYQFNMEITKSRAGHVERMGENRNAYIILMGKP